MATGPRSVANAARFDEHRAQAWGQALADARRHGAIGLVPVDEIGSIEEAEAVQIEACEALGEPYQGFSALCLSPHATDEEPEFVCCPLARDRLADPAIPFEIPHGLLGLRCALLFTCGVAFPANQRATRRDAIDAMIRCDYAVELLGRRVPGSMPLDVRTANADFALHVATFRGPTVQRWAELLSMKAPISMRIDGNVVRELDLAAFVEDATRSLVWLGNDLDRRRRQLGAGDIVTVGSPLPALQVLPGQIVRVDFSGLAAIEIMLT